MDYTYAFCEILIFLRRIWIGSAGHTWLKKESRIGSHFMMIRQHIWFPSVELFDPSFTGWMYCKEPVPVQVEPIMVGSCTWPYLIEFPVTYIGVSHIVFVRINPTAEPLKSIRIITGVQENHCLIKQFLDLA